MTYNREAILHRSSATEAALRFMAASAGGSALQRVGLTRVASDRAPAAGNRMLGVHSRRPAFDDVAGVYRVAADCGGFGDAPAPYDYSVILTAHVAFNGYGSDRYGAAFTESTMAVGGIAIALSLVSRYMAVVAYIAVSLPSSPWMVDAQGKLIYARVSAFVSATKKKVGHREWHCCYSSSSAEMLS